MPGGAERQDSVRAALAALPEDVDLVLVHDAARCLTPVAVVERVVAALRDGAEAVVPVLPVADTVKQVDGDRVVWQQGFGSTERDGGTPVTVDTIFSVQSMTKTFTATAAMQAVQAGRLDLDEPQHCHLKFRARL